MTRHDHKEPLYRKVNTRARNHRHPTGPDYRHQRNTKRENADVATEVKRGAMKQGVKRGLDYTPLFRFLLSKAGEEWGPVYREARIRLDREDPIFWLVARTDADKKPFVRCGEASYYSGLYVDPQGRLALVDPGFTRHNLEPSCECCTHTFNGQPVTRKFRG
jgi:hypothetical protein